MTGEMAPDDDRDDDLSVREDQETGRFELLHAGQLLGFATYRDRDRAVVVPHVETLWAHRGQGFASHLMDGIVEILRAEGRTIVPLCPFAASYMRDHPEHRDLLTSG